jgi:formate-dependent nitrite reductase cytochrome c552 subunit
MVFWLWLGMAGAGIFRGALPVAAQTKDNCIDCHSRQKDKAGAVVSIYQTSTHGRASVGCEGCHGGDSSQPEKSKAHAGHFIARPDTSATLEMCGACHSKPLEFFKGSRHVAARPNAARLDCIECHGVHAMGAASESFRWPQFCAGCHGLEYLPQLPRAFQDMLSLADDLREGLHRLEAKGRAPAKELIERRKDIRHMISELVHKTDARSGLDRISGILESGASLKQQIASEERR